MRPALAIATLVALAASASAGAGLCAEDRYGPPAPYAASANTVPVSGFLSWPGKTQAAAARVPQAPPPAPVASAAPQSIYADAAPPSARAPARAWPASPAYAPPVPAAPSAWTAYAPPATAATSASPAAPVVAAASQPMAGQVGAPPRFYSVSRQYGVQPDPIALSPQFLADSANTDLAEPPPPPGARLNASQTAGMSAAAATNQARAAQEASQAADPADSAATN